MTLPTRLILALGVALPTLTACPDKGEDPTTTTAPLTTTGEPPGTTTDEVTTGTPTTTTGAESSSSGEPAEPDCVTLGDEASCAANPECAWKSVVQFTHGAQGCAGSITPLCVQKEQLGGASAWYRDFGGDPQVIEYTYDPGYLGPEWTECGCDGPLACLCTSVTADCPERLDDFCGAINTELGCNSSTIKGDPRCGYLRISPEGPADLDCSDVAFKDTCVPVDNGGAKDCPDKPIYTFGNCGTYSEQIFWRDNAGTIEITSACGPQPVGWTACEADDTPEQPDECACICL